MNPYAVRLTPSNSPFLRSTTPRSPTKHHNHHHRSEEPGLRLQKVIGTTAATPNGFDCVSSTRQFAYTAGAAAVVATVAEDLTVTQHFFRARPLLSSRDLAQLSTSPTAGEPRSRPLGQIVKDASIGAGSPLGTPGRDWSDSPTGKSLTAKDRVKAATSVALSPNGKWVAIGETGYKPRVLIFSNRRGSSEAPVAVLADHTFGVHALAFSADSRYLASLGTVNDGFLNIWSFDDRTGATTLHSSNKCTAVINAMTWVDRSLVTAGLRFVKVWRPDEEAVMTPSSLSPGRNADFSRSGLSQKLRVLAGKNSLLGDLLDTNFVTMTATGPDKAIICADSGEICLLDDTTKSQVLRLVAKVDFPIMAATVDEAGTLLVAGSSGSAKRFEADSLCVSIPTPSKRRQSYFPTRSYSEGTVTTTMTTTTTTTTMTTAMASISGATIELDSKRVIRLTRSETADGAEVTSHTLPAHDDVVLGVQRYSSDSMPDAAFFTFSSDGSIRIWSGDGDSCSSLRVPVETSSEMFDMQNELRAATPLDEGTYIAAGDRYGTLSVLDVATNAVLAQVRAHSAEIVSVVAFEQGDVQLIATGSRDRMIQLFVWRGLQLELLQTMDEHAGAVGGLLTARGGDVLVSFSADRTIVVREAMLRSENDSTSVAYVILRTITLKSSPSSMCLEADDDEILVSLADRTIAKYNIRTGQAGFSFKCSDLEGGEAMAMAKVLYAPSLNGNPTIIGVSSGDKSVRLYSEYGSLIARDWGHTEGITDVALLLPPGSVNANDRPASAKLVTVAADSTIFMWDTASQAAIAAGNRVPEPEAVADTPTTTKNLTPMAPPLRKVLSHSELSRFRTREKSFDDDTDSPSPPVAATSGGGDQTPTTTSSTTRATSPQRSLRSKNSRVSLAQAPKLEPSFRPSFADSTATIGPRRRSTRKRSPSPPSPRATSRTGPRRPPLSLALRSSRSSENILTSFSQPTAAVPPAAAAAAASGFGSLTAATESVCRTLRSYRKKLAAAAPPPPTGKDVPPLIAPNVLRDLEKELKLTARLVADKAHARSLDEALMTRLLDQAGEKFAGLLDERIRDRGAGGGLAAADTGMDATTGALSPVAGGGGGFSSRPDLPRRATSDLLASPLEPHPEEEDDHDHDRDDDGLAAAMGSVKLES